METRPGRNGGKLKVTKKGGPSPNPKGKPKGTVHAKTVIKRWLKSVSKGQNPITEKTEKLSQFDQIVLAQLIKARGGDTQAFNALLDRTEGKPKQAIVGVDDEGDETPLTITLKLS